jgi:predicted ATP-binding protein involved in virulence
MRKITEKAVSAFMSDFTFNEANTTVSLGVNSDGKHTFLQLHGNTIAKKVNGKLFITNCGWFTNTTKERLNAIPGVSICQKKGNWYLNGNLWDGKLIEINN